MTERPQREIADPAKHAGHVLDSVLEKGEIAEDGVTIVDESLKDVIRAPEEAYEAPRVVAGSETEQFIAGGIRERLRVLVVSADTSLWELGSRAQLRVQSYAELFAEVHIIVLTEKDAAWKPIRLAPNVWVYPTNSSSTFWFPYDAYKVAKKQLLFADGFRADVVTAENPFEAGIAGYAIARKFRRALEVQFPMNPFESSFRHSDPEYRWHRRFAKFLLTRAHAIRVPNEHLREALIRRSKKIKDRIEVLPIFHDVTVWKDAEPQFNLHERYPLLPFIVLGVSPLTPEGSADDLIAACVPTLLKYPTVGLVIVGDGPMKDALMERIAAQGLANQIIIEPVAGELFSYVKTANVLLDTSRYDNEHRILFEAAAAGLPVITSDAGVARHFFEDGKNAFVCPAGDTACFSGKLEEFLSNNHVRTLFTHEAQDKVFKFIDLNMRSYQDSLGAALARAVVRFSGEETTSSTSP